jgi:hypothetical protein
MESGTEQITRREQKVGSHVTNDLLEASSQNCPEIESTYRRKSVCHGDLLNAGASQYFEGFL